LALVQEALADVDFLILVAAERGAQRRTLLPAVAAKVRAAARLREEQGLDFALQVEGDLDQGNIEDLVRGGADILVVGSDIFTHIEPKTHLAELIRLAAEAGRVTRA
jgi:ribulose-phosphate 3-epimerase